jgi:hypothetical protein
MSVETHGREMGSDPNGTVELNFDMPEILRGFKVAVGGGYF